MVCSIAANAFIVSSKRTWNVWYGHGGNVKWGVMSVRVLLAFERAMDGTTARPFSRRKCPYQFWSTAHPPLSEQCPSLQSPKTGKRGMSSGRVLLWGSMCWNQTTQVLTKCPRRRFPWSKIQKEENRQREEEKSQTLPDSSCCVSCWSVIQGYRTLFSSGSECSPWWWCYQELWQPLANIDIF